MIFYVIDNLISEPVVTILSLLAFCGALVICITIHEFSHAFAASTLGDKTARRMGRLTLNPKAHLDPLGTLLIFFAGFGWGKPTPVNPYNVHRGPRIGMTVIALAGPASNLFLALVCTVLLKLLIPDVTLIKVFTYHLIHWNLVLAVFNMMPLAPLDGFKFLIGVVPVNLTDHIQNTERFGPFILLAIVFSDSILGTAILSRTISPVVTFLERTLLS